MHCKLHDTMVFLTCNELLAIWLPFQGAGVFRSESLLQLIIDARGASITYGQLGGVVVVVVCYDIISLGSHLMDSKVRIKSMFLRVLIAKKEKSGPESI